MDVLRKYIDNDIFASNSLGNSMRRYMENDILTNHAIENTILIYEKCIQKINLVNQLYKEFKYSKADEHLEKLEMVFLELKMSIDESASEELAQDLYRLYDYILEKLYETFQFRKTDSLPSINNVLTKLIEGYRGALEIEQGK